MKQNERRRKEMRKNDFIKLVSVQPYQRYLPTAFTGELTMLEKINSTIENMNKLGKVTNDLLEKWDILVEWVLSEGLKKEVINLLNDWLENGIITDLLNNVIFDDLNERTNDNGYNLSLNNGSTENENNYLSIQGAIDFIHALGGGVLRIGKGNFDFDGEIYVKKGVYIEGNGKASTLVSTSDCRNRFIFHEESGMKNLRVKYQRDYNDTAFLFWNRYLIPLDNQTTPTSKTENVRVYIENVYLFKESNYELSHSVGLELYSEGRVPLEVYSGYWGVNTHNIFIDGFKTAHYIHADDYGWVNGCVFDTTTVDKCKHFLITEKREGSLGIDYNRFVSCMVQTRSNTGDLIIENGSRTIFDEFTVWDARVNDVKMGNAEFMRNPINFDSVPVTRLGTYIDEGYHYIGRFIGGRISNVNHIELSLTTSFNRRVNLHIRHDQVVEIRDYQGDFPYTDIEVLCKETPNNGLDVYIRAKKEYYFSIYAVSMRNFALSNRDKYDSVTGLSLMPYLESTQIRTRYAKALFTPQTVEDGGRLIFSSENDDFTIQDGLISSKTVKRIRIVCNIAYTTTGLTLPNRVTATLMVNDQIASTGGSSSIVLDDKGNTFMNFTSSILIGAETNKYWIRLTNAQGQQLSFVQDPRSFIEVSEVI